ncbi:MAG: maleylpyruvate isomerase family mycothiol-dependent enzyme [Actinomycetota bacterium]|nr:maleylpyruvate isomerase family mycothiol-dependent enzyme [Actinomycetota bacterium]
MEIAEHIRHLRDDGELLAEAAAAAGGDARVPTCPEWTVRDLVLHVGEVHRWAAATVVATIGTRADDKELARAVADAPIDFDDLVAWFCDGHGALVDILTAADPAADSWHFLPAPSGTAFWARRQAHETAIHGIDAEGAVGHLHGFDATFAVDGLDELLLGFMARRGGRLRAAEPCTLVLQATDTGDAWTVRIGPDGRVVTRATGNGNCVVKGLASDLYVALWNRSPVEALDIQGDRALMDLWRSTATISWGT